MRKLKQFEKTQKLLFQRSSEKEGCDLLTSAKLSKSSQEFKAAMMLSPTALKLKLYKQSQRQKRQPQPFERDAIHQTASHRATTQRMK